MVNKKMSKVAKVRVKCHLTVKKVKMRTTATRRKLLRRGLRAVSTVYGLIATRYPAQSTQVLAQGRSPACETKKLSVAPRENITLVPPRIFVQVKEALSGSQHPLGTGLHEAGHFFGWLIFYIMIVLRNNSNL